MLRAYRVLERMRAQLPVMQPESGLMYAHAMYFFAKAEQGIYFGDFNRAVLQITETIHVCLTAKKFLHNENSQSMFWIDCLHRRCGDRMQYYLNHINKPKSAERQDYVCPICGKPHPNQTGMHLVPLLLIKHLFPRFKELAIEENNAMAYSFGYVGRDLGGHIDEIRGYELTEEERDLEQLMDNPLTCDYLWCTDCEHRFTHIENAMLAVHEKQLRKAPYEYKVPYLFWLSIFWRMSVGKMGINLGEEIERKIADMIHRAVEPDGTFHWDAVETCFYYGVSQCRDTRDEPMGIWGSRQQQVPYVAIIGNLVMTFFPSKEDADRFKATHDKYMHFNNGTAPEVWDELDFKIFWDRHLFVSYQNAEYEMMHLGQSDRSDVILPTPQFYEMNKMAEGHKIMVGDYHFMKGKYPMMAPLALREILPKRMADNQLSMDELAKDSIYSAEEVAFMLGQLAYRLNLLTDNLKKYYDSHPIKEDENFAPQMYGNGYATYIQFRPGQLPPNVRNNVRNLFA